jgi:hypothetical protein
MNFIGASRRVGLAIAITLFVSFVLFVFGVENADAQVPRPGPNSVYTQTIRLLTEDAQPKAALALEDYTWGNGQTIDTSVRISYEFDRSGSLFGRNRSRGGGVRSRDRRAVGLFGVEE